MSAIPGVIRAVYNAATANLPGVEVYVGPGVSDTGATKYLFLGLDDPDESVYAHAVSGSQQWAQLGGLKRDETFTLHCMAVAWNGNGDALEAMDDAFSLLAGLETAIVSDPTFNGAALFAPGLTRTDLKFTQDNNGAACHIPFDIEFKARI